MLLFITFLDSYFKLFLSFLKDNESKKSNSKNNITYSYNHNLPIVFIGGIAGSGLELLRELLNQDSSRIRCGPETRLLTTIIEKNIEWLNIRLEKERLHHAGMTLDIIDSAVAQFILQVLLRHETITPRICNKDIYVFKWAPYLKKLFPNSKFILMMRDPRATVSSLIKRKFPYHNIRLNSYSDALVDWNLVATIFHQRCVEMGSSCRVILYEKLVLNPNATLNEIYRFLDMHEDAHEYSFTEHRNGVDTLLRKVLLKRDNLFSWLNDFPKNLIYVADKLAPLMVTLGYDTTKIVPNNLAYTFNKTV